MRASPGKAFGVRHTEKRKHQDGQEPRIRLRVSGGGGFYLGRVHETDKSRLQFGGERQGLTGDRLFVNAGASTTLLALSPLDLDGCALWTFLGTPCLPRHAESLGGTELEKAMGSDPNEEREKESQTVSKSTRIITQKDQLFPIIIEDRTRGNRPTGLRFKFRYSEGFPSSVKQRPGDPGKVVWVKSQGESHL